MKLHKIAFIILLTFSTFIFSQEKFNIFQEIKEVAKEENKNILIKFSGSDWCIPCIKLQKKVIEDITFQSYISKNLIYIEADFPRKKGKLSKEIILRNEDLAATYNKQGVFPKMVLIDSNGKVLKFWDGFDKMTAENFIKEINLSIGK